MKIQQAAHDVLKEVGGWLTIKQVARIILDRGMVESKALDPVDSIYNCIAKSIRNKAYNSPKIVKHGHKIGLPGWGIIADINSGRFNT